MTDEEGKLKKLEDEGTRYEHYSDLISLWEEAVEMVHNKRPPSDDGKLRSAQLEAGLELLHKTLDGMTDYRENDLSLRKLVDYIPTAAEAIEGGRGTPLQLGNGVDRHEDIT
jgi:hypothetical protein